MSRKEYDTFLLEKPAGMADEQRLEQIVRDLTPEDRRYKYRSFLPSPTYPNPDPVMRIFCGYGWEEAICWTSPGPLKL